MTSLLRKLVLSCLMFWASSSAIAQDDESLMTYDLATQAMAAAEAYAREAGAAIMADTLEAQVKAAAAERTDGRQICLMWDTVFENFRSNLSTFVERIDSHVLGYSVNSMIKRHFTSYDKRVSCEPCARVDHLPV